MKLNEFLCTLYTKHTNLCIEHVTPVTETNEWMNEQTFVSGNGDGGGRFVFILKYVKWNISYVWQKVILSIYMVYVYILIRKIFGERDRLFTLFK